MGSSCSAGGLSKSKITSRAYMHFETQLGVPMTTLVYDFVPEFDLVDLKVDATQFADWYNQNANDVPVAPAIDTSLSSSLTWGGQTNPKQGNLKGIFFLPVALPTEYATSYLTNIEIVDVTQGDTTPNAPPASTGNILPSAGDGITCNLVGSTPTRESKVETLLWGISVFTACSQYVPVGGAVGLP